VWLDHLRAWIREPMTCIGQSEYIVMKVAVTKKGNHILQTRVNLFGELRPDRPRPE
jgi:hypothetical protein